MHNPCTKHARFFQDLHCPHGKPVTAQEVDKGATGW